jgi:hypothetical protein
LLASPINTGVHTSTLEYASTTNIFTTLPSSSSWFRHVGVHNSTPEYASTASILKPVEKKFLKKRFSPKISSKALSPQETELKKERKRKRKGKALKLSLNKGEVNILRGERHFVFKNPF